MNQNVIKLDKQVLMIVIIRIWSCLALSYRQSYSYPSTFSHSHLRQFTAIDPSISRYYGIISTSYIRNRHSIVWRSFKSSRLLAMNSLSTFDNNLEYQGRSSHLLAMKYNSRNRGCNMAVSSSANDDFITDTGNNASHVFDPVTAILLAGYSFDAYNEPVRYIIVYLYISIFAFMMQ